MAERRTGGSAERRIPLGAGSQTLKGAALVAAAVLLGIILLNVVDDGGSGPASAAKTPKTTTTTSVTTTTKKGTTTTTARAAAEKTPAQLKLIVLNAGAPTGSAGTVSQTLRTKGYTNQGKANNDPNHISGKKVLCKSGLTRETAKLVTLLGKNTTKGVLPTGSAAPPHSAGFDCVVLVGA